MIKTIQTAFLKLRSNKIFELVVVAVIIISALEIGAKTYDLSDAAIFILEYLDVFITIFFLCEILVRFIGEEEKKNFFKSGWNIFDTLVVVISLIPVDESEMALLARLIRIFRVLRMISIIPELRILINSLLKALPRLGYVVLLMFIIFYIYAAVGSYWFSDINQVLWGDIAISMLTLFRVMTFEDWTDIQYETMEVYRFSWIFYMTFIFFTAFAFLNMVIGIVVGVMDEEHTKERNEGQPSMLDLQKQIELLSQQVEQLTKGKPDKMP
ncbi:voltage-gated sodium channel [Glaciecola punicea ACAM 611]|uniref:Voltage-gated sodium channel n=1 Tax=Glaciecola punicea ACAM 611 TaxID=1121923 RepID=H5TEH9_9ALTE|nr:ion transporter [Glaciecola punicea]OFA32315.1 ion transporter [Glaciecola punicea]GAB56706.1 voltage-gated sodium channel [Glaciecola punicea ACAM 611]